ncbi:MAG: DHHW family protein [Oscillospiraceae bacterium]
MKPKYEKKYKEPRATKRRRAANIAYLVTLTLAFETVGLSLVVFPRSTESITEKRELKEFPEFTAEDYVSGKYTADIAEWFSDTVPFRDDLTNMSTALRELRGFRQDGIRLHNVGTSQPESKPAVTTSATTPATTPKPDESEPDVTETVSSETAPAESTTASEQQGNHEIDPVEQEVNEDDAVNITNNGIAVVGTRALMLYGGSFTVGESYAGVINKYKEALGDDVNVYSMIIPTSCEFYSPPSVAAYCGSELDNINHVIDNLRDDVKAVDVYTTLASHKDEDIYMRTDHHWASLGAYYAAKEFAAAAGVPFMDISEYEQRVVHDYVGTMYGYSGDIVLKNNREDFFYYVPKNVEYTTTYYDYILEDGDIVGAYEPYQGNFFMKYSDGNGMAYCTFMGGDAKIVKVSTDAGNGRKLAIFKDSFGNALPPFLMGSFEEIYVIDMRYFTHNVIDYLTENGVTDVLFANNAFHAATASTVRYYENFLTQKDWGF